MIKLSKETIDDIFDKHENQHDVTLALYFIAFPDYYDLEFIDGHPKVSTDTNKYIFDKFMAFDREHHPNVINGGLWLNKGFGSSSDIKDWIINVSTCKLIYNEQRKLEVTSS